MPSDDQPRKMSTRSTRGNSSSDLITLADIKSLMDSQKEDIIETLSSKLDVLHTTVSSLISKVDELENKIADLKRRQDDQQQEIDEIHDFVATVSNPETVIRECQNRINRQKNVVAYGFPEKPSGSITEKKQHDRDEFRRLVNYLDCPNLEFSQISRIGRPRKDGNRLLRVAINDIDSKRELLRKSKLLKTSQFHSVYLKNDLTPMQQEREWNLRHELQMRRNNGEDVVIVRGEIKPKSELNHFRQ